MMKQKPRGKSVARPRSRVTRSAPAGPAVVRPAAAAASGDGTSLSAVQTELKAMLLAKRNDLLARLREDREGRRESSQREKIEGTPFGDRPALSPDEEMGFAVADRRAEMVGQIQLALKKMDEGNYGRCEVCEEPINVMRLRAQPFAVRCTRCQEAWEREQSRGEPPASNRRPMPDESS
jgi:DnaK suppressor protein